MAKLYDWVKQTVSGTPGTGPITLATAVDTFITMADAGAPNGELVYYTVVDGSNRERGIGTYSTTGPTLTRTFIQGKLEAGTYTENPGTGLTLTSAAIVGCSPIAATHNFRGCLINKTAVQSIPNSTDTLITFNNEIYDTDGFHDNVTNNTRITIPSGKGIRKIRLNGRVWIASNATGRRVVRLTKNGINVPPTTGAGFPEVFMDANTTGQIVLMLPSGVINVTDGDYFELQVNQNSGVALNIDFSGQAYTWFSLEVIE